MEDYTAEMVKDMAFSFCPQCGTAIVPNHRGRPRKFCSPECRSRWNNIIFSKYASTGDGILTSLKMMEVMLAKKVPMSKLAEPLTIYPQVLENVRVTDKKAAQDDATVQAAVKAVTEALGDTGRILVRESGTEPVRLVLILDDLLATRANGEAVPVFIDSDCVHGSG